MKKVLRAVITFVVIIMTFNSCGGGGKLDYTPLKGMELFDAVNLFSAQYSNYKGKEIIIKTNYSAKYNFNTNQYTPILKVTDPTGCCADAYFPILKEDGIYPKPDTQVTLEGLFHEDKYIQVYSMETPSGNEYNNSYDYDATKMSKTEYLELLNSISETSEHIGKTIRICGHYIKSTKTLNALSVSDNKGYTAATIKVEDVSKTLTFPEVEGNVLNPVEIIGEIKVKSELRSDGKTHTFVYISVTEVYSVIGVMS